MDSELKKFIRQEIAKQINVIVWGQSQGNQDDLSEEIGNIYQSQPTMTKRPLVQPYGFHSKAPQGTPQCVARSGEHPGARSVIGHLDNSRPPIQQGESIFYNQFGQQVYLKNGQISARHGGGKITLGSDSSNQPLVLGTIFKTMMDTLLAAMAESTHITTIPGYPTSVPVEAATYTGLQASPIDDKSILSDHSFTEK